MSCTAVSPSEITVTLEVRKSFRLTLSPVCLLLVVHCGHSAVMAKAVVMFVERELLVRLLHLLFHLREFIFANFFKCSNLRP